MWQVTDKYREAGKIVNFALQAVISQLAPGA
jgi:methionine aminopeptidase